MKLRQLVLLLPVMAFSFCLTTGCGGRSENQVIEAAPTTAEEEAAYEEESGICVNVTVAFIKVCA